MAAAGAAASDGDGGTPRRGARAWLLGAAPSALCVSIAVGLGALYFQNADPEPFPRSFDDFSHLLAADTFARGRLANPTPPDWERFESPRVLLTPRYVSANPPVPGFLLAVGQGLGDPLYGAALGYALACVAVLWMLRGWTTPGWALVGAGMLALHAHLLDRFAAGFSGGSGALLGGALALGALPRLRGGGRAAGAWLGAGLAVLALASPWAAIAVGAVVALRLGLELRRAATGSRRAFGPALAMAALVLAAGLGFKGYYHWRTTGSVLTSPAALYEETYAAAPELLFQARAPAVEYRHETLRIYYSDKAPGVRPYQLRRASWKAFWKGQRSKFQAYWHFYLLFGLSAGLLALPFAWRDPATRFAAGASAVFLAALAAQTFDAVTQVAAFLPALVLLWVGGLRALARFAPGGWPVGTVAALWCVALGLAEHHDALLPVISERMLDDREVRREVEARLGAADLRSLVFVTYRHGHDVRNEWVYNGADLEAAPVLWARAYESREENQAFADDHADREPWLLASSGGGVNFRRHPNATRWAMARKIREAPSLALLPEEQQHEIFRWLKLRRSAARAEVDPDLRRWRGRVRTRFRRQREDLASLSSLEPEQLKTVLEWVAQREARREDREMALEGLRRWMERRVTRRDPAREALERLEPETRTKVIDWLALQTARERKLKRRYAAGLKPRKKGGKRAEPGRAPTR